MMVFFIDQKNIKVRFLKRLRAVDSSEPSTNDDNSGINHRSPPIPFPYNIVAKKYKTFLQSHIGFY